MNDKEKIELFNARRRIESQRIELARANAQIKELVSNNRFLEAKCEALVQIIEEVKKLADV